MLFFQRQPKGEEMMRTANMSGPLVQLGGVTYVNMVSFSSLPFSSHSPHLPCFPTCRLASSPGSLLPALSPCFMLTLLLQTYDGPDAYNGPEVRNAARPGLPRNRSMHIIVRDPTAIKAHEARMQRAATAAVGDVPSASGGVSSASGGMSSASGGVSTASGDAFAAKKGRRFSLGRKSGKKVSDKDRFKAMEREMDVLIAARF